MAEGFINDRINNYYEYINSYFYSILYLRRLLFGLVTHEAGKEMAEGFINDRKGGNYEYINGYFYSWVYHRRLLLGLVGNEVRQEMVRKRIKT